MHAMDGAIAETDAQERKNRPILMGEIAVGTEFAAGYAMLAAGVLLAFSFCVMAGQTGLALVAVAGFALTLILQCVVSGI